MTSKEALWKIFETAFRQGNVIVNLREQYEQVEKDLEVLEIIKKKEVAIDELKNCIKNDSEDRPALEEYNDFTGDENSLTQEEYTLLKEWLEND